MTAINKTFILLAATVAFALHNDSPATAATVVFNNIASSSPYYQNAGNWFGTLGNQYAITATTFTPSASGQLDELTLGVTQGNGVNSVTLRLSLDTGGLPGTPIWQTTVPPAPGFGTLLSVTGIGGPTISSSQLYWVEAVAPVSPTTIHSWWTNNQGDTGPVLATGTYYANIPRFALRVAIAAVPEPASCLLLVCGVLGLGSMRRRCRG